MAVRFHLPGETTLRIGLATLAVALMFASSATGQDREGIYDVEGGFLTLAGFNAFEQFDNSGPASVDDSLGFSLSGGIDSIPGSPASSIGA